MRSLYSLLVAILCLGSGLGIETPTQLYSDPAKLWAAHLTVSDLPADGGAVRSRNFVLRSELRAGFANDLLILRPYTNSTADSFWFKPDGAPNKQIEATWDVDDPSLVGQNLRFSGNSVDYSLPVQYSVRAFIKVFSADYTRVLQEAYSSIESSNQFFEVTIAVSHPQAARVRYGFITIGPNAAQNSPAANSRVTIRARAVDRLNIIGAAGFDAGDVWLESNASGRFVLTSADQYYTPDGSPAPNVNVYEGRYIERLSATLFDASGSHTAHKAWLYLQCLHQSVDADRRPHGRLK